MLPVPFEVLAEKLLNGYSPLLVIVGDETGIGKSMLACRTAELVYKRAFNLQWKPEGNLFFRMSDFSLELMKSEQRIFVLEEGEIELGSDDWHSIQNRWFSRMKSTQRIKGNLYIIVLPMFMQLARKHRRAVNYMFDVKHRGFFNAYKIRKNASQILGDEISRFHIGSCVYNLPLCKEEFDVLDKKNKQRIEIEESEKFNEQMQIIRTKRAVENIKIICPYCDTQINFRGDVYIFLKKLFSGKYFHAQPYCRKRVFLSPLEKERLMEIFNCDEYGNKKGVAKLKTEDTRLPDYEDDSDNDDQQERN